MMTEVKTIEGTQKDVLRITFLKYKQEGEGGGGGREGVGGGREGLLFHVLCNYLYLYDT